MTLVIDEKSPDGSDGEPVESATPAAGDVLAKRGIRWMRAFAYGVLPALVLLLAVGVGYVKWMDGSARESEVARTDSLQTAIDGTIAMLSYQADTVDEDLRAARDRMSGSFKDSYTALINDVVIPGAKEKRISAMANVPAAAAVSASQNHAVVLVFVNQSTTIGEEAPTSTASTVRVALDKVDGRWLISGFDPI